MKRFDFRLQRVIEVREMKKKECQRELAKSQQELNRQETLLEAATTEYQTSHEGLRRALKKRSSAGSLATLEKWRGRREEEVRNQSHCTAQQRRAVDGKRAALIMAAKDKKILERLKEHALEEHRTECQREEQSFLDELGCRIGKIWKYPREDKHTE